MSDDDLTELMEDAAARDKNPQVYEAAFTEWARRQPDVEPAPDDLPPPPDPWDEPDPTASDRLDMLRAERDDALERLRAEAHEDDASWQEDLDRYEVYSVLIAHEEKLTASPRDADAVDEASSGAVSRDGTAEVEISAAQRKQWEIMEQAEQMAAAEGISYEEALGRVQGLDPEQVRRREFVRLGRELGYSATSFNKLVDEVHQDYEYDMQLRMEDHARGHVIAREHRERPDFWSWWNENGKSVFRMTDAEARKYLSPEAKEFFDEVGGRVSKSDLVTLIEAGRLSESLDPEAIQIAFSQWDGRHKRGDYLQ
ncbi:hypothetical protein C6V83_18110 [Gordonia iterans]|uniref:Uncharacterized protein n=1 Tax=Gordonia iterans TaxID=1004901 RepID=A0A2S0KJQ6_9ACTN|nr:hypothetical protein [Gordonia iterans]AVM01893.1 hypothetical protein C6V83_18110 [Gordonia iterans]